MALVAGRRCPLHGRGGAGEKLSCPPRGWLPLAPSNAVEWPNAAALARGARIQEVERPFPHVQAYKVSRPQAEQDE